MTVTSVSSLLCHCLLRICPPKIKADGQQIHHLRTFWALWRWTIGGDTRRIYNITDASVPPRLRPHLLPLLNVITQSHILSSHRQCCKWASKHQHQGKSLLSFPLLSSLHLSSVLPFSPTHFLCSSCASLSLPLLLSLSVLIFRYRCPHSALTSQPLTPAFITQYNECNCIYDICLFSPLSALPLFSSFSTQTSAGGSLPYQPGFFTLKGGFSLSPLLVRSQVLGFCKKGFLNVALKWGSHQKAPVSQTRIDGRMDGEQDR